MFTSLILALCCNFAFGQAAREPVPATANDTQETIQSSCYATVGPLLDQTDGQVTPEVRTAYLSWARSIVTNELCQSGQTVSHDCMQEVWTNESLRVAVFGSVFPPDPSILQNYAHLRLEMGSGFMEKYRSLAIAVAVAKRTKGVEKEEDFDTIPERTAGQKGEYYHNDAEGNYQSGFWMNESLKPVKTKKEKALVAGIADFMKARQVTALELYQNQSLQQQLSAFLQDQNVAPGLIAKINQSVQFGEWLKNAMVLLGQRPATRDDKPDTVTWLRYLVSIYESTPASTPTVDGKVMPWPLFPIDKSPWPLLMPLARPMPLKEAKYIWETFQDMHGSDRYHTYGPFRNDADAMPYELQPSPWFWDAWPDRIVHGGECVPISKGTVDLYSSLGKPAVWAGQPGHANLISFQFVGGGWSAEVEQAFAGGPDVTFAQWYFDDDHATTLRFRKLYNWAGAEYHLGLALGMNRGLQSYMDTRMADFIFNVLPPEEKPTLGKKLLMHAAEANPFNPVLWYRLAILTSDRKEGLELAQTTMAQVPDKIGYWTTVQEFVTRYTILAQPVPQQEKELISIYNFLQKVPGIKFDDVQSYAAGFYVDLADKGDAYGKFCMGQRYRYGAGVKKDEDKARELLTESAAQGNKDAPNALRLLNDTVSPDLITVSASSQYSPDQDVRNLVNGNGIVWCDLHDNDYAAHTMWHTVSKPTVTPPSNGLAPSPAWVRFDFTQPQKIDEILIWNHNQLKLTDRGFNKTHIYGSANGSTWFSLTVPQTIELPRERGDANVPAIAIPTVPTSQPITSIIIAADAVEGNYGSDCYGLSAVHFLAHPDR